MQLLLAVHDSEIDFDAEDIEIFKRVAGYYRANLDTDMQVCTGSLSTYLESVPYVRLGRGGRRRRSA